MGARVTFRSTFMWGKEVVGLEDDPDLAANQVLVDVSPR